MSDSSIEKRSEPNEEIIQTHNRSPSNHETESKKKSIQEVIINFFKKDVKAWLSNKYNLAFLGILLLAFLIRLKYIGQESIWNDAAVHLWYAIKVTKEPLFFFSQDYLTGDYTIPQTIMAFFYLFTKNAFLAGKIVATIYALIGIIFMYLLGTELKDKFNGLIVASLLAFNHIFLFYSVRPLADSPLLVTTIILLYSMTKLEKLKTPFWGFAVGLIFLVAMFTKVQSSLFVFALLIYYSIFRRKEMIKDRAILLSWVIPVSFVIFAHVLAKVLFNAEVLTRIFSLFLTTRGLPYGLEAFGMIQWIFGWYLLILTFLGFLLVLLYRQRDYYFGIILMLFYYLFFEINVDNTQDRYVLPLLSVGIILAAFAIREIGHFISMVSNKRIYYIVTVLITIFIAFSFYQVADPLIISKSTSYAGYPEAGSWIKDNVPNNIPIFAGSPRMMRAFIERDFAGPDNWQHGGSIWYLRSEKYLENKSAFEDDLYMLSKESEVYLEVDIWEYTQPSWYFPLTQDSFNYFSSLGFYPVKIIEREINTQSGLQKVPVIFILKKDRSN